MSVWWGLEEARGDGCAGSRRSSATCGIVCKRSKVLVVNVETG